MPIQTAEADKRLPVDENSGFADAKLLRPGDQVGLMPTSPNLCCQNQGVWERPEYPPASHGVLERKNIPAKFFLPGVCSPAYYNPLFFRRSVPVLLQLTWIRHEATS